MSRKFKLEKDYYEEGTYLYKKRTITIEPGITVLVGCNGIGKTTLLHQMKSQLKKENIPYIKFDNLNDGGSKSVSEAGFYGDMEFMATAMCSSEGENIVMNMGKLASKLRNFIETGDAPKGVVQRQFEKAFGTKQHEKELVNERWILLDAIDSGLSVDNVVDLKEYLFRTIFEYSFGNEIYIIVSANAFEMARGEQCFDVYNGKYIQFKDYEEYRQFVLNSRDWKEERDSNNARMD